MHLELTAVVLVFNSISCLKQRWGCAEQPYCQECHSEASGLTHSGFDPDPCPSLAAEQLLRGPMWRVEHHIQRQRGFKSLLKLL
ncbi:hypothetical protein SISNIDRAFT_448909 [Sistotremastrum niveocremeum HHB9708]|uniref:CHY-type domain-containing protein n=2 Tax=Sistotremastraceae TaxID=3402574 RepID=A0A165A8Q2_9AGAM|nr:hypothetical protein SISNIDRAFT_448909 [Sistotremastrum niveocremeum HHB9708]KZT42544.1 hypothetical protein SISSUDRAFT_1041520 [Sistotremastrum suecicum HHB10207 ss-3]